MDQRVALPLLQKLLGVGEHGGIALVVGRGKIDKRLAQHAAHTRGFGFFRDRVFEVVHVGEGGHPGANLFGRSKPRPPAHEIFINVLRFGREDVLVEPVIQGHIVVQSAEQGHRDVRMTVDESRQHQLVSRINSLPALVLCFEFGAWADRDNRVSSDHDRPVVIDSRAGRPW